MLTLSLRSSTILLKGPPFIGGRAPGVGAAENAGLGPSEYNSSAGDEGAESPRTVVLGRKRDAMMTLWCLSELIAEVVVRQGQRMDGRETGERNREKLGVSRLFEKVDRPHR